MCLKKYLKALLTRLWQTKQTTISILAESDGNESQLSAHRQFELPRQPECRKRVHTDEALS